LAARLAAHLVSVMDLREAVERFSQWLELSRAPSTAREYRRIVERFVRFCGKRDSSELDMADVTGFVAGFGAASTRSKVAHALRRFLRFVGREDLASQMPFPRGFRRRYLEALDEEAIRRGIEALGSPRDRALIALAYWLGLRISEALLLRRGDYDPARGTVRVTRVKMKGGARESHELPLAGWVKDILDEYLAARSDGDPRMFPFSRETARRIFKRFARAIGAPDLTFHVLRHSRGTQLARDGRSPAEIAAWLHHLAWDTSLTYIHLGARDLSRGRDKYSGNETG